MKKEIKLEGLGREMIEQTTRVRIYGGQPIDVAPKNNSMSVEVPTDLGDSPLVIAFMNAQGDTLAELGYDQKAQQFRQPMPDPDDTQRQFELALQIGNKAALDAFLAHYPGGFYADLAKAQLEQIHKGQSANSPKA
jgi:hypothetical protein